MADSMDYALTEDQAALVSAVQTILRSGMELPQSARLGYAHHNQELQRLLQEGGYLDAGRDLGTLEAALGVIETGRIPVWVEAAATARVVPRLLPDEPIAGPVALIAVGAAHKAIRNLSIARTVLVDLG